MNQPLVTVYMPTCNRAELLVRALDSLVAQHYKNIEVIVVNDGSRDNTLDVLARYQELLALHVITNTQSLGACASRNKAIMIANGEFITGLDDDDEFLPNHIENLVAHWRPALALDSGKIALDDLLYYNKVGNQVLCKTKHLQAIGGFDESLPAFQDHDCWVRLCHQFGEGLKLSDATYVWHTAHEHNRISNSREKRLAALDIFIKKHQQLMSPSHMKSMRFLKAHISETPLSIWQMCAMLSGKNYKRVIMLYIKRNLPWLKRLLDKVRGK
jgi:glycosyltransferase involved in cell wall biosynthesis